VDNRADTILGGFELDALACDIREPVDDDAL